MQEEKEKIQTAAAENPEMPLGPAEQFLLTLSTLPELCPRLKLWLFMLDYANIEKEIVEPLMDLKLCMEELEKSATFANVMATLLAVGNVLNGAEIKGFQLDYLSKVSEVKDTVHKHSLVHHLCLILMDKFPEASDLYSELGAVARCSKVDFKEIKEELDRLESECKRSWDYLRVVAKHESPALKQKISDFLADCAQRISTIKVIHRRVNNRFYKFLFYMGMPPESAKDVQVNAICKTITEFALDYRNSRDRILQMQKRAADKRERRKTRGKIWAPGVAVPPEAAAEAAAFHGQDGLHHVDAADAAAPRLQRPPPPPDGLNSHERFRHEEMSKILTDQGGASAPWGPGTLRRTRRPDSAASGEPGPGGRPKEESPDDEILDGLVKAATARSDATIRDRRKARQFNRKSRMPPHSSRLLYDVLAPMRRVYEPCAPVIDRSRPNDRGRLRESIAVRRTRTLKLVEDQVGDS